MLVAAALLLGCWRQWVPLAGRGILADQFGILPQWRFFAQARVARADCFDDHHLLARTSDPDGDPGPWMPVFAHEERRWSEALWNPQLRPRGMMGEALGDLAAAGEIAGDERFLRSRIYLMLLRHCLTAVPLPQDGCLQFAVVATRGRGDRDVFVRFLSAWHQR